MSAPKTYSAKWCFQAVSTNLYAATECAREQKLVRDFWSDDAPVKWADRHQLTRLIAREKRRRALSAIKYLLVGMRMWRAGFVS